MNTSRLREGFNKNKLDIVRMETKRDDNPNFGSPLIQHNDKKEIEILIYDYSFNEDGDAFLDKMLSSLLFYKYGLGIYDLEKLYPELKF